MYSLANLIIIVAILVNIVSSIIKIILAKNKYDNSMSVVEYILDVSSNVLIITAVIVTRNAELSNATRRCLLAMYISIVMISFITAVINVNIQKDVFMELLTVIYIIPFIMMDFFEFDVFTMMSPDAWVSINYYNSTWYVSFMDCFLLFFFLIAPLVDSIYTLFAQLQRRSENLKYLTWLQTAVIFLTLLMVSLKQVRFGKIGAFSILFFFVFLMFRSAFNLYLSRGFKLKIINVATFVIGVYAYFGIMLNIELLSVPIVKLVETGIVGTVGIIASALINSAISTYATGQATDNILPFWNSLSGKPQKLLTKKNIEITPSVDDAQGSYEPVVIEDTMSGSKLDTMSINADKAIAAAVGTTTVTGAVPIPFADAPLIIAEQVALMTTLCGIYEINLGKDTLKMLATSAIGVGGATIVGRTVASNLLKLIPGAGTAVGGAISGGTAGIITFALGKAYSEVCKMVKRGDLSEDSLSTPEGARILKEQFKEKLKVK